MKRIWIIIVLAVVLVLSACNAVVPVKVEDTPTVAQTVFVVKETVVVTATPAPTTPSATPSATPQTLAAPAPSLTPTAADAAMVQWLETWKKAVEGKTPQQAVGLLLGYYSSDDDLAYNCEGGCEVNLAEGQALVVWADFGWPRPAGVEPLVLGSTEGGYGAAFIEGPWEGAIPSGGAYAFEEGYDVTVYPPKIAENTIPEACVPVSTLNELLAKGAQTPQGAVAVVLNDVPWASYSVSCSSGCNFGENETWVVWGNFAQPPEGLEPYFDWSADWGYGLFKTIGGKVPATQGAAAHRLCPNP